MELEAFEALFAKRKCGYKSHGLELMPLKWRRRIAGLTRYIDYHCNFNVFGYCKNREYMNDPIPSKLKNTRKDTSRNCCSGCYYTIGYLNTLPPEPEVRKMMAHLYSEEVGFWRHGAGCTLPRQYRAGICLWCNCSKLGPVSHAILAALHGDKANTKKDNGFWTYLSINCKSDKECRALYGRLIHIIRTQSDDSERRELAFF